MGGKPENFDAIAKRAVKRAKYWLAESKKYPNDRAAELLAKTLKDPSGLDFTVEFVDGVIRPEDKAVSADKIAKLAGQGPSFLPQYLQVPLKVGGKVAPLMPKAVVPMAEKVFQQLVGDLVLDAKGKGLTKSIARLKAQGARLNMNLLGEAVLGNKEAAKRMADTIGLLERDDVDYVSMKVSAVIGPHNPWAYEEAVDNAVAALLPLYSRANSYSPKKFINLDMEEYHDLHMTIDVFKRILERPEFKHLRAGIVLQAYLPDALPAMEHLQAWAAERVADGGAPIKVRVVKGANLSMERVQAVTHGWELVTEPSKEHTDANYVRVLEYALRPEHLRNVNIGVAGMNLFTAGFAYELAQERGLFDGSNQIEFEMLAGMAAPQAQAVKQDTGHLLFYVPVVNPEEYDVAIAYLVRRLEENALPANFMSSIFEISESEALLQREENRFLAACAHAFDDETGPNRKQNRQTETEAEIKEIVTNEFGDWEFQNTPDSDPSLPANLQWAREIAGRMQGSQLGLAEITAAHVETKAKLAEIIDSAAAAATQWAARPAAERAQIIHQVGIELAKHRGELIEVAGSEAGKTIDQGDVEVSEACDFAHYYAEQAKALAQLDGAVYKPSRVIAVTPPWNFPMAIPAGGVLAALASGASVIFKPASLSARTGAYLAKLMWDAGVPREVLRLIALDERSLGEELIRHPKVDRVILTGSIETAKLFKSWRPELGVLAETSGKDSIIVTPHADLDLAAKDVINSAFGHAGQKCSACSTVILVGSVAKSKRFRNQLLDGVKSLHVGYPWDLETQMGPLVESAKGKLLRGLTELEEGENWALKPRQLDESGKLWSPGVRVGVKPGSAYHLTEYFGPILGVMTAETLEEAVELQNATEFGLTAGIHSLDAAEINYWLTHVAAGNAYINRGITGAIVRRQPFGGWKRSAVGAGTKAGGPSYLYGLGSFERNENIPTLPIPLTRKQLIAAGKISGNLENGRFLTDFLSSAEQAITQEFAVGHDPSGLVVERNVLRYQPLPVLVRLADGEDSWQLVALTAGALELGSQVSISARTDLEDDVLAYLHECGVRVKLETDEEFNRAMARWARDAGYDGRIRLIGGDYGKLAAAIPHEYAADVAIWYGEVTLNARVDLLPFVHEQAVSFTNHRFGNPTPLGKLVQI
ncbi:bifunctional proline dehydrogenase/L-glutamate gamma-semialdehyde dehydrogenase [Arcanobacterium hippocoleae]|uniref:L-glutamate gamma-semialdehyde dehydrogenase n=1 Tax=Arcanobacterium hippocoleae TaxID=149017 RepID=A0ABU1T1A6_9ACTO|nr:bifunctional proline dehydrogenase/L-glutamate gamma-semialdehyde dehydrogenase [Arcanobacterium hippocoleae]MDR6939145.1 RHH-type proline utilization regulon transcriptional repressor/proline dehydrogenase/delta 1-pyrroline-5-carboxylate dehydrogenase [Arcanobacterium hippocoleae]